MKRHATVVREVLWNAAVASSLGLSIAVQGAGFEKAVPFSGRYGGIAGAGASVVEGPEALYFNPAALSAHGVESGTQRARVSLNFSPTPTQFEGALSDGSLPLSADTKVSPFFAAFGSFSPWKRVALGAGIYTAGGSAARYEGIEVSPVYARTDVSADLRIVEKSAGVGVEIVDGLFVGGAFRQADVEGELSSFDFETEGYAMSQVRYRSLTASRPGYRLGIRFAPRDAGFGFGASYRSRMDFTARGRLSGHVQALAGPLAAHCAARPCEFQTVPGSMATSFPMQANVGAFVDVARTLRTVVEYSFTQYGRNDRIVTTGKLALPDGTVLADMGENPIELGWRNQHQGKIGLIYTGLGAFTLRAGYSYVGQVTARDRALPTFSPPAPAHVAAFGLGARFGGLAADVAYEYSSSQGTGVAPTRGEFRSQAHALHAGVSLGI